MQGEFDVFLSYHWRDQAEVTQLAQALQDRGVSVFIDRWYLKPGHSWLAALETVLTGCKATAVCIGPGEMGPWQQREMHFALMRQIEAERSNAAFPVIPVLLPGAEPRMGLLSQQTWVDFRAGLHQRVALEILVAGIRNESPGPVIVGPVEQGLSKITPFRGLSFFREEDAPFFFGRESAVGTLEAALRRTKFVALIGASGSGKSSVVRAGLTPKLRRDLLEPWEIAMVVPNDRPLHNVAAALVPLLEPDASPTDRLIRTKTVATELVAGSVGIRDLIEAIVANQPGTRHFLLIVDQWEELYTLTSSDAERRRFIDGLLAASNSPGIIVVICLRGDFVAHALSYRPLSDRLQGNTVNLGPMNREELRLAIVEPVGRCRGKFDPGLVERLLNDAGEEPGNLPLLEFVLQRMWEKAMRAGGLITHEMYESIGCLQGALANTADAEYLGLTEEHLQDDARSLFLQLVQLVRPGSTPEKADTRRRVDFIELSPTQRMLVRRLADARILVTSYDPGRQIETVEVAHEALIKHWQRLRTWLDRDREFLLWRDRLRVDREDWLRSPDVDMLLSGIRLAEAQRWQTHRRKALSTEEHAYIDQSFAEQRRQSRSRQRSVAFIVAVLMSITVLAGWQWWLQLLARDDSERQRARLIATRSTDSLARGDMLGAMEQAAEAVATWRDKEKQPEPLAAYAMARASLVRALPVTAETRKGVLVKTFSASEGVWDEGGFVFGDNAMAAMVVRADLQSAFTITPEAGEVIKAVFSARQTVFLVNSAGGVQEFALNDTKEMWRDFFRPDHTRVIPKSISCDTRSCSALIVDGPGKAQLLTVSLSERSFTKRAIALPVDGLPLASLKLRVYGNTAVVYAEEAGAIPSAIAIYDLGTRPGGEPARGKVLSVTGNIIDLEFLHEGKIVLAADRNVLALELASGTTSIVGQLPARAVRVAVNADPEVATILCEDGSVVVFHGMALHKLPKRSTSVLRAYSVRGLASVLIVQDDGGAELVDYVSGHSLLKWRATPGYVRAATYQSSTDRLLLLSEDGYLHAWQLNFAEQYRGATRGRNDDVAVRPRATVISDVQITAKTVQWSDVSTLTLGDAIDPVFIRGARGLAVLNTLNGLWLVHNGMAGQLSFAGEVAWQVKETSKGNLVVLSTSQAYFVRTRPLGSEPLQVLQLQWSDGGGKGAWQAGTVHTSIDGHVLMIVGKSLYVVAPDFERILIRTQVDDVLPLDDAVLDFWLDASAGTLNLISQGCSVSRMHLASGRLIASVRLRCSPDAPLANHVTRAFRKLNPAAG